MGKPTPVLTSAPGDGVQDALDRIVELGVPGVLLRHSTDGAETVLSSGAADLRTRVPMRAGSRWRIGSLTKTVTAVVVLQLVREGRLGLDRPLAEVLPGQVPGDGRITIRCLLRHTSGLHNYTDGQRFQLPGDYVHDAFTPAELVRIAVEHGPAAEPGWKYCNTNYVLLGMIVEALTGESLSSAFTRRVFDPLGMADSRLPVHDTRIGGPHPTGHHLLPERTGDPTPHPLTEYDPSFAWAAYGMVSSTADVNRFYRGLFRGELLPRPLVDEMLRTVPSGDPVFPSYGLGLEDLRLTCGITMWGHTGSIPGFSSYAFCTADGGEQVSLALNIFMLGKRAVPIIYTAADAINRAVCGEPYPGPDST